MYQSLIKTKIDVFNEKYSEDVMKMQSKKRRKFEDYLDNPTVHISSFYKLCNFKHGDTTTTDELMDLLSKITGQNVTIHLDDVNYESGMFMLGYYLEKFKLPDNVLKQLVDFDVKAEVEWLSRIEDLELKEEAVNMSKQF